MKKPELKSGRKMTNLEVLRLYYSLVNLRGVEGIALLYAIKRTTDFLKPLAEAFGQDALIPMSDDFKAYQNELREKAEKLREKLVAAGDATALIDTPQGKQLNPDHPEFVALARDIRKMYIEAVKARDAEVEEYNQFLQQECTEDIRLYYFPLSAAPTNKDTFDVVAPLIRDFTPEQEEAYNNLLKAL